MGKSSGQESVVHLICHVLHKINIIIHFLSYYVQLCAEIHLKYFIVGKLLGLIVNINSTMGPTTTLHPVIDYFFTGIKEGLPAMCQHRSHFVCQPLACFVTTCMHC